jgi:hypothetical protein
LLPKKRQKKYQNAEVRLEKRAESTYAEYRRQKRARQVDVDSDYLFGELLAARCLSVWLWEVQRYQTNALE